MSKTILFMQRRARATCDGANWEESKHKRDNDGKFSSTGGGGEKKDGGAKKSDAGEGGGKGGSPMMQEIAEVKPDAWAETEASMIKHLRKSGMTPKWAKRTAQARMSRKKTREEAARILEKMKEPGSKIRLLGDDEFATPIHWEGRESHPHYFFNERQSSFTAKELAKGLMEGYYFVMEK